MRQSAGEIGLLDVRDGAREIVELPSSITPKVLIADDDPSIVRLLADHCARMGFDVDTASNGIQALLKASRTEPDTLVIDVNMPEVDGLSVCARLLDPERTPVNVIVMTGSRNPETLKRCEGFGVYYTRKGPNFGTSWTPHWLRSIPTWRTGFGNPLRVRRPPPCEGVRVCC